MERKAVKRQVIQALAVCFLLAGSACSAGGQSDVAGRDQAPPSAPSQTTVPTVLVIDGSGSMSQDDAPGSRIEAAKAAARTLVEELPDDASIALHTYGTATGSGEFDKAAGCRDVTTLVPLGSLNRETMSTAIDGIVPSGYTPISLSLETAVAELPEGSAPQAIVLISDGEETCDTPPCETAVRLRQSRPRLTISTIGFKVDGQAGDQLRCIADSTGGLYAQAANADQLAARLVATQNIGQATASLSANGMYGVNIGATIAEIRSEHGDFPEIGSQSGGVEAIVVWRDCDFVFTDGVLTSISPRDGGRTIDGIAPGSALSDAVRLYGEALSLNDNGDGTSTAVFDADPNGDTAYRMIVGSDIRSISLCRCKPQASSSEEPERVVIEAVNSRGETMPGFLKDSRIRDQPIDCGYAEPSPYDVTEGVRFCGATADSGDACWPTAGAAYVLCLADPFEKVLMLRAAEGADVALSPRSEPPRPMGIELADGTQCRARNGGSWSAQEQHPDFVGQFSCKGGSVRADYLIVWSPADIGHGIAKGPDGWTVQIGGATGPLTTMPVSKVFFVGVA